MDTRCKRLFALSLSVSLASSLLLHGQAKAKRKAPLPNKIYAEPWDAGRETARVLGPSEKQATFVLTTSWIPGPDHKGYFRWQMNVAGEGVALAESPKFINSLHRCTFTLNAYDHGGFVLRHVPLPFMRTIADSGDVTSMSSNDLVQMDVAEYENFILGSWDVSWNCQEL